MTTFEEFGLASQGLADELYRHWRLLWPLGKVEREKRISEIADDLRFEHQLNLVRECFA